MLGRVMLGALAICVSLTGHANACYQQAPQRVETIVDADVVIKGEIVGYERLRSNRRPHHHGLIHVRTLETWKGEERANWIFQIGHGLDPFVPHKFDYPRDVIMAGIWSEVLTGEGMGLPPLIKHGDILLFKQPCSRFHIYSAEPKTGHERHNEISDWLLQKAREQGGAALRDHLNWSNRWTPEDIRDLFELD